MASQSVYCDTHAHINGTEYAADRARVVESALAAGLAFIVDVGTDAASSAASLELAAAQPRVFATVGVHPHEASRHSNSEILALLARHERPKVVAIGEMGLDYFYDHSPKDRQREAFSLQADFALRHSRPAVIHCRDAMDDMLGILSHDFRAFPKGVFHCYAGDYRQACTILDAGMYLSFGGLVTFKKNDELRALIAKLPLDRMLLETDCPYLTPVPHRGKRNEPANVRLVAAEIARVRGLAPEEVGRVTTANARQLFGIQDVES
ncbi:MAG: TatD family hydrolase [Candidatus Wallbacteria bacterium]|nr:TatD family hydrolase [Candidatus Wallbacteria bacterium]